MRIRFVWMLLAVVLVSAQDGGVLLNNGWTLRPAGEQVQLDTFPMKSLLSPDGNFVLVLHAGLRQPSVRVLSAETLAEVDRQLLEDAWLGMSFAPGGRTLYVSGGATGNVYEFGFSVEGKLNKKRDFSIVPREEEKSVRDFVGDVQVSPDGRLLYVAAVFGNEVRVINPQSGWVVERFPAPRRPYRILLSSDGQSFFVTSWAEGSVHRMESANGNPLYVKRLGLQPMDMAWRTKPAKVEEDEDPPSWTSRLFVATAATNLVHVLGETASGDLQQIESVKISMWPHQPLGMTPAALALSRDQNRLYVVCSDANVVAVVDVSGAKSRVLGFVPVGWYPTAATPLDDGRLLVLNGKGNGASVIEAAADARLFEYTKAALALSPYNDEQMIGFRTIPDGNPIPPGPRVPPEMESPIRHVLYIVKGIYDGAVDEEVTPNQHKLAREFVRFDNFNASGDGTVDGIYWATAAIAPPFVQLLGPSVQAGRLRGLDFGDYELAAAPPTGFLWTQALLAGMPVRNYGFAVKNRPQPAADTGQVERVVDPALTAVTARDFRGIDAAYPDVKRAQAFLQDLSRMDSAGEVPRLMVMRLGADSNSNAAAADNDQALGMIVEVCSKTKAWPEMAIFVVESQASGREGNRSNALVISPYARRGATDSTFYNSTSVLRTIELILGLNPMTQFDAASMPMWAAFRPEPDTTHYTR